MNVNMTQDEFNDFVMLYLFDQVSSIDEISLTDEYYVKFITNLKEKSFIPLFTKVFVNASTRTKVTKDRFMTEIEKDPSTTIRVLV